MVGLAAEAGIAARFGFPVQAGGGTPAGAGVAASRLIKDGATALVSFGLAGGLDPMLRPGTIILPHRILSGGEVLHADPALANLFGGLTDHTLLAGATAIADAAEKQRLHAATGAHAVDLESGAVARIAQAYGRPFCVLRAICDPAERSLPKAALVALDDEGKIGLKPIIWAVLRQPVQVLSLLVLARDAARARRALLRLARRSHLTR